MNYNHTYRRNRIMEPSQLLAGTDIFHTTTDQKYMLGCILDLNDGRRFRYCEKDGTTALAAAYMCQACEGQANWQLQAKIGTNAIGVTSILINSALSTALAAHDLDDGYLLMEDAAGEANMYIIKSHTIGTTPRIELADTGGLRVATTTATTEISLIKNVYKDVLVLKTNQTGLAVGVPLVTVPVDNFYWSQVRGPCPLVQDDTDQPVVGDYVVQSDSAAGTGALPAAIADDIIFGTVIHAAATAGDTMLVNLMLE